MHAFGVTTPRPRRRFEFGAPLCCAVEVVAEAAEVEVGAGVCVLRVGVLDVPDCDVDAPPWGVLSALDGCWIVSA